ncbi:NAD(P)-binding domain protein [Niveomyces insectorum RCEF 264]|uniref:NAD(P)-binding domain protein n=1 Tax=Niveomyces insectorum RCEF 264 TaxID=1081102 RepID=A0A167RTT1_9HYPO|nr:NAD(P)-binding domain protein [Niveomyces insectorum RCEF 264]
MSIDNSQKPIILHIGDPVRYNKELYDSLRQNFTIIRPSVEERQRDSFLAALRAKKWGDFSAVMRPFWSTGGEMGRWDKELIPLLPASLKVYASAGAGYDWADVDLMAKAGILYCNGASASSEAVADMAIYHIISVFRNMQWSNMAARSLDVSSFLDAHHNIPPVSRNPQGHILGIIGLGNIGYRIATKAHKALDMRIVYFDPYPKPAAMEAAIDAKRMPSLDILLAEADCVLLAAPGTGGKILDAANIAKIKKGARIVNIARGNLIDEDALVEAVMSGHVSAVGLDVHENEPNVNARLASLRSATLTCHTAGGALETNIGFERLSMENVRNVLTGQPPLTPVNKHLFKPPNVA